MSKTAPARRGITSRNPALIASGLFCLAWPQIADGQSTATPEPLVISKVQLVFSVVSHYSHIADRIDFYNNKGEPRGNENYAVPFLVCDPIVTLYNPTSAVVTRPKARVAIYDPPVGFRFKKNGSYLRTEFETGEFHGLARFQIANEGNAGARKSFTLLLREMNTNAPGKAITMQPGQSKIFAPWVESNWTWGLETSGGFSPRSFHDWDVNLDFTNRDRRTNNVLGVEAVGSGDPYSRWDVRAGFQTENLSYSNRPLATRYTFEIANNWNGGWVGIKLNDTFSVEAQAQRVITGYPSQPDYRVDLLGGLIVDKTHDLRRSFPLDLDHLKTANPETPVISRTFRASNILQTATDNSPGGKTPFAVLTMVAKSRALVENRFYEEPPLPTEDLYELDFRELSDFTDSRLSVRATDAPGYGLSVLKAVREADRFAIDLATGPYPPSSYRVMGTDSLEDGFTDNVSSRSSFVRGPEGSGIGKLVIDVSGLGERYFVRVEEGSGP